MADMTAAVTLKLIDKFSKPMKKAGRGFDDLQREAKELARGLDAAEHGSKDFIRQQEKLQAKLRAGATRAREQARAMRDLGRSHRQAGTDARQRAAIGAAGGFGLFYAGKRAAQAMLSPVATYATFEAQMDAVQSRLISKYQGDPESMQKAMKALTAQARKLGATTAYTSQQVGGAQEFLAMAGFSTQKILDATPGMLSLAKATGTDLLRTADITSNILSGFGLDADQTFRVADTLAFVTSAANVNLEMLGDTMKYVAPVAAELGISLEEASAMAGLLGNVGIQGSMAGTSLRTIYRKLAAPTKEGEVIFKKLGVSSKDAEGNLRNVYDILGDLFGALEGKGNAEKIGILSKLVDAEAAAAFASLLNKKGLKGSLDLLEQLKSKSSGISEQMAKVQLDNLVGDVTKLASAFSGLKEEIGLTVNDDVRALTQNITDVVTAAQSWVEANPELTSQLAELSGGLAGVVAGAGLVALGFHAIKFVVSPITAAVKTIVAFRSAGHLEKLAKGLNAQAGAINAITPGGAEALRKSSDGVQKLSGVKNPAKLAAIGRGLGTISKGMLGLVGGPLGALFLVGSIVASLVLSSDSAAKAAESHQAALEKLGVTANSTAKDLAALSEQQKVDALFQLSGMQATQRKDLAERQEQVAKFGARSPNARNRTAPEKLFLSRLDLKSRDASGQEAGRELFSAYQDYRSDKITAGDVRAKIAELVHRDESLRDNFTPLFDALANLDKASEALNKTQEQIGFITGKHAPEAVNAKADSPAELRSTYAAQISDFMADFEALKQDHGLDAAAPVSSSQPSVLSNYGLGAESTAAEAQSETIVNEIAPVKNVSVSVTINANGYGANEVAALISQKLNGELSRALSDGGSES